MQADDADNNDLAQERSEAFQPDEGSSTAVDTLAADGANGGRHGESDVADWVCEAFEQHRRSLLRYCRSLTGNQDSAEEIVQESFARLCREQAIGEASHVFARSRVHQNGEFGREQTIDIASQVKRWLFIVCRRQAIDEIRKRRPVTMSTLQE